MKGASCPVCADRTVMAGYNDLATRDAHLLAERDSTENRKDDTTNKSLE